MGRVLTSKYRVEYRDNALAMRRTTANAIGANGLPVHSQSWNCKTCGNPSAENLEAWRKSMNASFMGGGVNFHCSEAIGFILHISSAAIVRQSDGVVICKVTMPTFEVA